jgi:hypothetical protein
MTDYVDFLLPQAIASATTQPTNVHPRNTLTTMTLPLFGIDLYIATKVGTK